MDDPEKSNEEGFEEVYRRVQWPVNETLNSCVIEKKESLDLDAGAIGFSQKISHRKWNIFSYKRHGSELAAPSTIPNFAVEENGNVDGRCGMKEIDELGSSLSVDVSQTALCAFRPISSMGMKNSVKAKQRLCGQWIVHDHKVHRAAATNNVDHMRDLLMRGISPNLVNKSGRTPLHVACSRCYTDMVRLLLEHGAKIECRDRAGKTPLHIAAFESNVTIVQLLLSAGANPIVTDSFGMNPLYLARMKLESLGSYKSEETEKIRAVARSVIEVIFKRFERLNNFEKQVKALSNVYSHLAVSNSNDQLLDQMNNVLSNIEALNIKDSSSSSSSSKRIGQDH